jgi:hypothetical protein
VTEPDSQKVHRAAGCDLVPLPQLTQLLLQPRRRGSCEECRAVEIDVVFMVYPSSSHSFPALYLRAKFYCSMEPHGTAWTETEYCYYYYYYGLVDVLMLLRTPPRIALLSSTNMVKFSYGPFRGMF